MYDKCEQLQMWGCVLEVPGSLEGMNMWSHMTERSASPGGPWRMGGLGFGLPLSRLYARYFGARPDPFKPCDAYTVGY